ncbi:MAG: polyphosphate kinase 1, partial [Rhodothermales bacterium]|nr:polyphosphate kinase 1 [Rhodothermales bacterium]
MEPPPLHDRELSWLAFNGRVLQEAADPDVPLYERVKFLAIFSSNLDEFFRVRVAGLRSLLRLKKKDRRGLDFKPKKLLRDIHRTVGRQQEAFGGLFAHAILPELARHGVVLRDERDLPAEQDAALRAYFQEHVAPHVRSALLTGSSPAPFLEDGGLYLLAELWPSDPGHPLRSDEPTYALVEVPSRQTPRFVTLPGAPVTVFFLDDVVRHNLPALFPGFEPGDAFAVKLTRDADLQVDDEFSGDLVEKIKAGLARRAAGVPSRLLYDPRMPYGMVVLLKERLGLEEDDLFAGGRYHNLSDLFGFPEPPHASDERLTAPPLPPLPHPELQDAPVLLDAIRERDRLLHFPYQCYDTVTRLLDEAARDPAVEEIAITLYRVAKGSAVAEALREAARRGKRVTAFVEVKARFDEANNLRWAEQLEEAGARVLYSLPGLKVHAKLALIARRERDGDGEVLRDYAYLGTGNFNEKTALVYTDHALLTADARLTADVRRVFEHLRGEEKKPRFEHLLVAPFTLRKGFERLIDREIAHARAGRGGAVFAKLNSLEDEAMIEKLYEADQAGVDVRLVVRGICRLVPGVPGWSDGIGARSIVDRFLEHARACWFANGGDEALYLASADWMTRNLSRRVEVAFPIYDPALRAELRQLLDLQWADTVKARTLDAQQRNAYHRPTGAPPVRAQVETYRLLQEKLDAADGGAYS